MHQFRDDDSNNCWDLGHFRLPPDCPPFHVAGLNRVS